MLLRALHGTTSDWRKLILKQQDELVSIFEQLGKLPENEILPSIENIFEFAKYSLSNVKLVILGQDPYPDPNCKPHGLAFSSLDTAPPKSLNRIQKTLVATTDSKVRFPHNNLESWARQGVCLLNTSLTVPMWNPNGHKFIWKKFMTQLIADIEEVRNPTWFLWGSAAQKIAKVKDDTRRLEWCHPIAMCNPSFSKFPHFASQNIFWDIGIHKVDWFTDGACRNNQDPRKARASWAYHCTAGPTKGTGKSGLIRSKMVEYKDGSYEARPTNIRGEGQAIINCLLTLYRSGVNGRHTLYTDSKFWIDMIEDYMPKWRKRKIAFTEKKNSDLSSKMWSYMNKIMALPYIEFHLKFTPAAHDYTPTGDTLYEWTGNNEADKMCNDALD